MSNRPLYIIGAGDLGQLIAHHAIESGFRIGGFLDDTKTIHTPIRDSKVVGAIEDFTNFQEIGQFVIAIGYKHFEFRKNCFEKLKANGVQFATIVHPSAYVDSSARIGAGSVIFPSCTLDAGSKLHENVLLNTAVTIAHDTEIGKHSFLSPRVALAGFIQVGEQCMLGINSTIIDNISIANRVIVGGGSVVIKNLTEEGTYVGVPARKI